jgi:predicted MFS family arabinose efflux permease
VLADAFSFVVSAVLVGRVRSPERVGHVPIPRRRLRQEIGEGMVHLWHDRRLRGIAFAAANVNFFGLLIFALLVVYLTREQGFSAVMVAAVTVASGVGALIGALLAPRVAARIGRGRTIVVGSAVFSVSMFAIPAAHGPRWLVLAVLAANEVLMGVAIMLFDVTSSAFVLTEVPRALLARVNASQSTVTQGVKAIGALTGGVLGTAIGLRPALWVGAIGATTTVLWTWFSPLRDAEYAPAD